MLDQALQAATTNTPDLNGQEFDLVVIGAGIAGLNALNAASEYLPKGARALLVDQKDAPGGMWNTAYDYVRLHQPHPMFTVGNMKWDWRKPRNYLAARDEVQQHLSGALGPISENLNLKMAFGQTVSRCEEVETSDGVRAEVSFGAIGGTGATTTIQAKRAIHAAGLNYALADPLSLSSTSVLSIIPQDLRATIQANPTAPVVVVGGGKTGMDTILAALAQDGMRQVLLIKGQGTNFFNRTEYIPTGLKRWTSGMLVSRFFRDVALHFDGDNESATLSYVRQTYSTDPASDNGAFLFGLQSEEEMTAISAGLESTHADYLEDVVDTATGPVVTLRSGSEVPVAPGSIIVNCTGSFFRTGELATHRPLLSPHDCILSINTRDALHFLTSVSGFFATHLFYRDQLRGRGFYTVDMERLFREDRCAWIGATAAQAYLTQIIAVQTLPLMLLDRCGLDLDRWYPWHRRMAGLIQLKSSAARDIAHCRNVLDRVAQRFDVHAAPLE